MACGVWLQYASRIVYASFWQKASPRLRSSSSNPDPMAPAHHAGSPREESRWRAALEVLLIVAVFAAQAGWPAPDVNEPHYLGKAKHYWNHAWAPGDFFFEIDGTGFEG